MRCWPARLMVGVALSNTIASAVVNHLIAEMVLLVTLRIATASLTRRERNSAQTTGHLSVRA